MKIIVLVKEVPDTYDERKLDLETGLADRNASARILDEIGERALEVALTYADNHPDADIVLLSMGPDTVPTSLRKGLAMGASSAFHVLDDALLAADLRTTAEVLAATIARSHFDLVICGNLSTDGSGGVLPAMIGELLGVPTATGLSTIEISDTEIRGRRAVERGTLDVEATLPAVISVTEALPDARFPNFKGIMAAKKKPLVTISLADLGMALNDEEESRSIVLAVTERPARAAGVKIVDEGDAGEKIAEYLISHGLAN